MYFSGHSSMSRITAFVVLRPPSIAFPIPVVKYASMHARTSASVALANASTEHVSPQPSALTNHTSRVWTCTSERSIDV